MRILVTGGAGFIGSHLVDALIAAGHQVWVIDDLSSGKEENLNPTVQFIQGDLGKIDLVKIIDRIKPQAVYHLAAQKSVSLALRDPLLDASNNIFNSLKLIEAAVWNGVEKFIFFSTGGALYTETENLPIEEERAPSPGSPYGLAKWTIENYLENFYSTVKKMPYVAIRPANVYGPRQDPSGEAGVIAIFINKLLNDQEHHIFGNGEQTRDFVYVEDVVKAAVAALDKGLGLYHIGGGQEISMNFLYQAICQALNKPNQPQYKEAIAGEALRSLLAIKKAKKELAWQPEHDLKSGLIKTIDWFKKL